MTLGLRSTLACLFTVSCLGGCAKGGGGAQPAAQPPQVSVARVIEKRVKDWDEYTGRMQAIESVEIRPRVSGYIDQIAFTEGKTVALGELLFVIDPRPYNAAHNRAAADA